MQPILGNHLSKIPATSGTEDEPFVMLNSVNVVFKNFGSTPMAKESSSKPRCTCLPMKMSCPPPCRAGRMIPVSFKGTALQLLSPQSSLLSQIGNIAANHPHRQRATQVQRWQHLDKCTVPLCLKWVQHPECCHSKYDVSDKVPIY